MSDLATMPTKEAASKALEVFARSLHKEYNSHLSFEEFLEDNNWSEDVTKLEKDDRLWTYIKYETSRKEDYTFEGLTSKLVDEYGGEGQGDQYWMVISISDGTTTRYFRKDGWYASYDGGYLDGETSEVKPKQVMVTQYV